MQEDSMPARRYGRYKRDEGQTCTSLKTVGNRDSEVSRHIGEEQGMASAVP